MLEVRHESGPHLLEQLLQLGVLGAGEEQIIQRVDDGLMVQHLALDVGPVEGLALQIIETVSGLLSGLAQRAADGVVLGVTPSRCASLPARSLTVP